MLILYHVIIWYVAYFLNPYLCVAKIVCPCMNCTCYSFQTASLTHMEQVDSNSIIILCKVLRINFQTLKLRRYLNKNNCVRATYFSCCSMCVVFPFSLCFILCVCVFSRGPNKSDELMASLDFKYSGTYRWKSKQ